MSNNLRHSCKLHPAQQDPDRLPSLPFPRWALRVSFALAFLVAGPLRAQVTLTIATVNNGDMIRMQRLSAQFTHEHPGIHLDWVVLEEKILREKTTTDAAAHGGQFDVVTIGPLETPIWGRRGWLLPLESTVPPS